MGFFHEGHLSLMRKARRLCDRVVVSIFVNPTQFAPHEDFKSYPHDLRRDLKCARELNVDLCFMPAENQMYSPDHRTEVHVTGLDRVLEGTTRPTHFAGVALVVAKLLHITEPDILVLGQKDAQQAVVLETLVRDLGFPVKVLRGPTVRERDGLAMSSRNTRLTEKQRRAAPVLWRALRKARRRLIRSEVAREPLVRLDYAAVVNARTLEEIPKLEGRVLIPIAAYLGRTRLIDNVEFSVSGGRS
jgi:pantoate--beta-alanine ligase